jgi:hypothetical protein
MEDQTESADTKKSHNNHTAFDLATKEDHPEGDIHQDRSREDDCDKPTGQIFDRCIQESKVPPNTSAPNRAKRKCMAVPNLIGCLSANANAANSSAATLNR